MPLRHRVSEDVMERYGADRETAERYADALAAATEAERALRAAQAAGRPAGDLHDPAIALDKALTAALQVAEAAERVAMGTGSYPPAGTGGDPQGAEDRARRAAEIATRKARAKSSVRPWTDEVDRLRTAREAHRLSFRGSRVIGGVVV